MPFSIIAILLILISTLSAAVIADMKEKSVELELTEDDVQEMLDISMDVDDTVNNMAFEALIDCCVVDTVNESQMVHSFESSLSSLLSTTYPLNRAGLIIDVNASAVRLSFLRLPLSDIGGPEGKWQGEFVPAYVGLAGMFEVSVFADHGKLTRNYSITDEVLVPLPLLNDRLEAFDSSVGGGIGELNELTREMLDSLCTYRALQGWGSSTASNEGGVENLITEQDAANAVYLGLVILQYKTFRNATACLDMSTSYLAPQQCWDYVKGFMDKGGSLDPVDVFLGIYGYNQIDWRNVFSQALYADIDRIVLRWMEHFHIIDMVGLAEKTVDNVAFTINDVIDYATGNDLAEGFFKEWLQDRFFEAGMQDIQYRYLFTEGLEDVFSVPTYSLELIGSEGDTFLAEVQGTVEIDFPVVDVLEWGGWGDFHEQFKKGTNEIIVKLQESIAVIAEEIGRSMYLPVGNLLLDPSDGVSFLEEIRILLEGALHNKDEWLRPTITAAERYSSTIDPLVEATKAEFMAEKDGIMQRSASLSTVFRNVAEQLMIEVQGAHDDLEIPWEENVIRIEQAIIDDQGWKLNENIISVYEAHASSLSEHFLQGLEYRPTLAGHPDSIITDIIARSGDPFIGIGSAVSQGVDNLLEEMIGGMELRGGIADVQLPESDHFLLLDDEGRMYHESLKVDVRYPSSHSSGLQISIIDPRSFDGRDDLYPQLHDTDLMQMKWASYQSVWGLACSGVVGVGVSPGSDWHMVLDLKMEKDVSISLSQTVATTTGYPLVGVSYHNINTMQDNLAKVIDEVLRPLQEGVDALSSGVQSVYRLLESAIERLLEFGTKALDLLSEAMQTLVEQIQHFVRASILGDKAITINAVANLLGEQVYKFSAYGIGLTIKLKPKDLAYKEVGVPASIALSFEAGECSISVTSRLIKMQNDYGFMANATLTGSDWAVYMVLDPFMDIFKHMVEVRGIIDGACIELAMPEVVSYQQISFALSDIPGVGALLSNIPTPIPGLKGSVDAGVFVKILSGRTDSVVINEYELNPAGEDEGREWVELYNPTSQAVDLAGWTIETTHGIQEVGSVGSAVIMPHERFIYLFAGQALDNQGGGFPFEECIVLRDSSGKRVDSTPFATDYWNDARTWQRTQDGADRWEFQNGTKGRSNGKDPFTVMDLSPLQEIFLSAVTESLNQLSSMPLSMETLAETLASALLRTAERLTADLMSKEVEIGTFVEVAATDYASTTKVGMRMELSLRCGTLGEMLGKIGRSAVALFTDFGNPFQASSNDLLSGEDVWVGISAFGSLGLPKMISVPGAKIEVQCVNSFDANIAMLHAIFGEKEAGWGMECGVAICGIPSSTVPSLKAPSGTTLDVWMCKAVIHEMEA